MGRLLKMAPWGLGNFEKAGTTTEGKPFSVFHANGPQRDDQNERMTDDGKRNLIKAAKEGQIDLTGSHMTPFPVLAKSSDGWVDDLGELFLQFEHFPEKELSMDLHKAIQDGSFKGGASLGGKKNVIRDSFAKTYTPIPSQERPVHLALTMPNGASYPEAGPLGAFFKATDSGDFTNIPGMTDEEKSTAKESFAKGKETYDAYRMINIVMELESLLIGELGEVELGEIEFDDNSDLGDMISLGKRWIAREILEKEVEEDESVEMSSADDGSGFTKVQGPDGKGNFIKVVKIGVDDFYKTDYSKEDREAQAGKGEALPDGSYPIKNKGDLKNAIQAYGRAKNKTRAKAHIIKRAKALGATDMLPKEWEKSSYDSFEYTTKQLEEFAKKQLEEFSKNVASMIPRVAADTENAAAGAAQAQAPAATAPEPPVTQDFSKTKAFTDMEKTISDLKGELATAQETIAAWKPVLEKLKSIPMPVKGAVRSIPSSFSKDADLGSAENTATPSPPATALEAAKYAITHPQRA